ncbi:MAG TPA: 6-carboxytetrahydropterin synthase [Gemmatimonadaceae bacterium]|nr:6-carboxytetrahydropterin synthase [Gemmatimonadaceae bacterium]
MPNGTAELSRRVDFAAAHRYRRPDWPEERNRDVFGACANEHYHGHGYACTVTVRGPIDDTTGMVVDLGLLDRILDEEITARFDHRNINLDVPEFADGRLVPTGENIARFIFERVAPRLPAGVALVRVHLAEDQFLSATFEGR